MGDLGVGAPDRQEREPAIPNDRFDALIRAQGHRFRLACGMRAVAWRLLLKPSWGRGALAVAYAFGAPAAGMSCCRRSRDRLSDRA
jgi:hypothetical protein